jgi:hypothetical protein
MPALRTLASNRRARGIFRALDPLQPIHHANVVI